MWRENDEDNDGLIEWLEMPSEATNRTLVHGISGLMDAGNAVQIAVNHILETLEHTHLAAFDIDLLFDYRNRRPRMTYLSDHFGDIELPSLDLVECTDTMGQKFILLHGQEPSLGWMTLVDSLVDLVDSLNVNLTVGMQAFPFPAPHTRPIAVTTHSTNKELLKGRVPWVGDMEVPGTLAAYLELQLGRDGHSAVGLAAHVPHYLANMEHTRSGLTLLSEVMGMTGLVFALDELRELADEADRELNEQLNSNPENVEVVKSLEQSFDSLVSERGLPNHIETPSGEEIAAQVEQFLAELEGRDQE